jgi:WD40 repeat protein
MQSQRKTKDDKQSRGFAANPVESNASVAVLPEFGTFSSPEALNLPSAAKEPLSGGSDAGSAPTPPLSTEISALLSAQRSSQGKAATKSTDVAGMPMPAEAGVLTGHDREVLAVALFPDGTKAASCSLDGTVRVWDLSTSTQLYLCDGHRDWVLSVAVSADGSTIASCSRDHTSRTWTSFGQPLRVFEHKVRVNPQLWCC